MFLILLVLFIPIIYYFSNYFRIFYYITKLPGPTAYPIIGNLLLVMGKNQEAFARVLQQFKIYTVCRIWMGPIPIVCTGNPDFVQKLLTDKNGLEKSFFMRYMGSEIMGNSIVLSKVPKWKHNRSIVVQGFSPTLLNEYFEIFVEKSLILAKTLDTKLKDGKTFDIFDYITETTLDTVCGSIMGFDSIIDKMKPAYFSAMINILELSVDRLRYMWNIPKFIYFRSASGKKLKESVNNIYQLSNYIILQKKKNKMNDKSEDNSKNIFKKPLLEFLFDITETNPNFTDEDLRDEANLLIMGGYETSANALSYILLNLAAHKNIQNKVYEELSVVFENDNDRVIDLDDLSKLTYMEMVIKESMRMFPTVPLLNRQLTEDMKLGDWLIPKGVTCVISIHHLHHNEQIWKNPFEFDPERFTPENSKNRHPYAYIPFSKGPRNCIGGRYAFMFMKTVLATLLRKYEFHTDLNINELKLEFAFTLKLIVGHHVRITERKRRK